METETHLAIAVRLGFVDHERVTVADELVQDVGRLLNGLIRSIKVDV